MGGEQFVQIVAVSGGEKVIAALTDHGRIFLAELSGKGKTQWTQICLPVFASWDREPPVSPDNKA